MKKTLYLGILAAVTVICIIVGSIYHMTSWFVDSWLGNIIGFISYGDDSSKYDRSRVTYSENLDEFDKIEIDTSVMDITVEIGDSYHLEYDCTAFLEPKFLVDGKTFKLEQPSAKWWGRSNRCNMTLTIPSDSILNSADIVSSVADIKVYNIESKDITIEADVGDITLKSCTFESSDITENVGNADISKSNLGKSDIETDVGEVDVSLCKFKDIDVYSSVGNITFNTGNDNLNDYEIDLSTNLGSVKYKGENQKKHYYKSASSTSDYYKIEVETDIGDIEFN